MKRSVALGVFVACGLFCGCKDDADEARSARRTELRDKAPVLAPKGGQPATTPKASSAPKAAATPKASLPKLDTSRLPKEIRREYEALKKLPAIERKQIIRRILVLASKGASARDALGALAGDASLPEPQRAVAGIYYSRFFRFDQKRLIALLDHPNPFLQRSAAESLAKYGGVASIAALKAKAARESSRAFRGKLERYVREARKKALPARANAKLQTLIDARDDKEKKAASVVLAVDYYAQAEADLLEIFKLRIADKDSQMWIAMALVNGAGKDVAKLKRYTRRRLNKFLRYNAVRELGKLGAPGKAVLKELSSDPKEPLQPHIKKLLK